MEGGVDNVYPRTAAGAGEVGGICVWVEQPVVVHLAGWEAAPFHVEVQVQASPDADNVLRYQQVALLYNAADTVH